MLVVVEIVVVEGSRGPLKSHSFIEVPAINRFSSTKSIDISLNGIIHIRIHSEPKNQSGSLIPMKVSRFLKLNIIKHY